RPVHRHLSQLAGQVETRQPEAPGRTGPDEPLIRPETAPEEPEDVKAAADIPITPDIPAPKPARHAPKTARHAPQPARHAPNPARHGPQAPAILRDLTSVLFTLAFGAALSYASVALATTRTLPPTVRAALVLLLAVSLGVAGALTWRRYPLPDLSAGLATLA